MLFSSIPFLYYFLPITLICYFAAPKKTKNLVLLVFSLLFYAWGEKLMVILFIASITVGYVAGLLIEKTATLWKKKLFLYIAVLFDLSILSYFKYMDFFISNINSAFGTQIPLLNIALPIGISFYTFQLLSYDIDIYRGSYPAERNFINFAAYVSMFPQLIAGPIVRFSDIKESLSFRSQSLDDIYSGIRRFIIGLSKKVLLANVFGELCKHFLSSTDLSVLYYWMYGISFSLQIFYDFSGYSDMAIGLGRIFGFKFMENFNYPFISKSITEFFRRWHISLGTWFRDYVYIPLGGNKNGLKRQIINIFIVWALTGLWHGASWNFVIWGLLYALLLFIEKAGFKSWLDKHSFLSHIYVLFFTIIGFIIFNASSLRDAASHIAGLFSFQKLPLTSIESIYYFKSYFITFVLALIFSTPICKTAYESLTKQKTLQLIIRIFEPLFLLLLLLLVTAYLVDGSFNPFLYFRF